MVPWAKYVCVYILYAYIPIHTYTVGGCIIRICNPFSIDVTLPCLLVPHCLGNHSHVLPFFGAFERFSCRCCCQTVQLLKEREMILPSPELLAKGSRSWCLPKTYCSAHFCPYSTDVGSALKAKSILCTYQDCLGSLEHEHDSWFTSLWSLDFALEPQAIFVGHRLVKWVGCCSH